MKIIRAKYKSDTFYASVEGETAMRLVGTPYFELDYSDETYRLDSLQLLAPVEPSKIVAVGKNYKAHADEMGEGNPPEPLLFLKPSTSVVGNFDDVAYPSISNRLDYEGELGVVIGRRCRNAAIGESAQYIFGYTCLNDITARDIQKSDPQWTRGKGFDTFCPIGPWIVTGLDAMNLSIETRVNGEVKQKSNTSYMTHCIDYLVYYISQCMTLLPGDVIATGTPEGIGAMKRGDIVEVEVGGIGVLTNRIV